MQAGDQGCKQEIKNKPYKLTNRIIKYAYIVIPACLPAVILEGPESFFSFQKDSRRALLAGMTGVTLLMVFLVTTERRNSNALP
jgi:hypothetical protein